MLLDFIVWGKGFKLWVHFIHVFGHTFLNLKLNWCLLVTFISLTCIWALSVHNDEKVIRPLPCRPHLCAFSRAQIWFCCCWHYCVIFSFAFLSSSSFLCGLPWLRCYWLLLESRIYEPSFIAGLAFLARTRWMKHPGSSLSAGLVTKSMWLHCGAWLFLRKSFTSKEIRRKHYKKSENINSGDFSVKLQRKYDSMLPSIQKKVPSR